MSEKIVIHMFLFIWKVLDETNGCGNEYLQKAINDLIILEMNTAC